MVFLTVPPHFQYKNEKKLAQPTRSFFTLKISRKSSPGWLQPVFHFGTGNREEQLKRGFERQLAASQRGERPLFRPRDWQKEERHKSKMIQKAAWYRPADVVGFYPPSPKGELVTRINKVLEEEGRRIGIKMRAIETGGLSLAK